MKFTLVSAITAVEAIARGRGVDRGAKLRARYGGTRWRKMKGIATVRLDNGQIRKAEIHWYEANGVGRREFKIKRYLN